MLLKAQCSKEKCLGELNSEVKLAKKVLRVFSCGHTALEDSETQPKENSQNTLDVNSYQINVSDKKITFTEESEITNFENEGNRPKDFDIPGYIHPSFYSLDGDKCAYEFQRTGVEFAEKSNFNCLIADAMGLGKTVQALITLKRNSKQLLPVLVVAPKTVMFQWAREARTWLDNSPLGIMTILDRTTILPGFQIYIISYDFLSRKGVIEKLSKLGIKTLVLDECQGFKNQSSKRTKALITFIQENKIPHRIALSGTPIKNRAGEYFTILNLLDPKRFQSYHNFCAHWLIPNEKGVYTRIDPYMIDTFREYTSKYIIRREKHDVLKNLPALTRDFQFMQIEDPLLKNAYNAELDLFANFMNTAQRMNSTQILGWLARMRSITGQAKVQWATEFTEQFLDETEDSIAVGIHHHSVRDTLHYTFTEKGFSPLKLSGEDNVWKKDQVCRDFNEGKNRLLIINCLAGGVGLNLQSCSNAVVLERMWNSADEEQFEARFHRDGQKKPVMVTYPIAEGTIDEWFHKLIADKRLLLKNTFGDNAPFDVETNEDFLKDLAEKTINNRLK